MFELRQKYYELLLIMREGYGKELTFTNEEISPRLMALLSFLNLTGRILDKAEFLEYLGNDWNWEIYCKVIEEFKSLGVIRDNEITEDDYLKVTEELQILYGRL